LGPGPSDQVAPLADGVAQPPDEGTPQRFANLPLSYHRWKWRVLLAFAGFYLFLYLGRFNFWLVVPLVSVLLALTDSPWPIVFLSMAGARLLSAGMMAAVKV